MKRRSSLIISAVIISILVACDNHREAIPVTDVDGNVNSVITIGTQVWMAENLKVTHYRDGSPIPNARDAAALKTRRTGAYGIYNNNASNEVDTYGVLYNWYSAVDSRNIAPAGWHVPSDAEWKKLEIALGMSRSIANDGGFRGTNEASKLAGNADLWSYGVLESNADFGTSGFTALPGGNRVSYGDYYIGYGGHFWATTESNSVSAWSRHLSAHDSTVWRGTTSKRFGLSIRCVRD